MREGLSYRFTEAVVRRPASCVTDGLRSVDRGAPDFTRFEAEHDGYVTALREAGLAVGILPPLQEFPDAVFIEDAALCLPEVSVILRPGAPTRTGEAEATAEALLETGHRVDRLDPGGFVDGGDILVTDRAILVGLSARTDEAGFRALARVLEGWGYAVQAAYTPDAVLHLKSDCCVLDSETILATSRLARAECFESFRVLTVPHGEEAAANSIRVNDTVLVPDGYPATAALLAAAGYAVETVAASQAALLDGGLSCMSLRFSRPGKGPQPLSGI